MARRISKVLIKKKAHHKLMNAIRKSKDKKSIRLAERIRDAKQFVKNLSSHKLNDNEVILLSKGVKFVPTPTEKKVTQIVLKDYAEYERRMRCSFLFEGVNSNDNKIHPFYQKTGYTPTYSCGALENYLFATKYELSKLTPQKQKSNMTKSEWQALKSLKSNEDIIIKKADKCSTLCVLDKEDYIKEGNRQLCNTTYYEQTHETKVNEYTANSADIIENAFKGKQLDETSYKFLMQNIDSKKLGKFFMLPKIHKIPDDILEQMEENEQIRKNHLIPGRPIVSLCGTPMHNIGHFIDYIILPLVQKQYTYTRDTKHLIRKIESLQVPNDIWLITFDASNMYTNLENTELLEATSRVLNNLDRSQYSIKIPTKETIMQLLKLILENNEFTFNDQMYRQKIGVPMGGSCSAELADLRMFEILENILTRFTKRNNIVFCTRFRDDALLLYRGSEHEIHELFELANSCHKHLKFTYEISNSNITFLDTEIFKGKRFNLNGTLDIRTHVKKTETFQYLDRKSSHPKGVFKGFIKGEILRNIRNTNNKDDLQVLVEAFKNRLLKRGYKETEINDMINETVNLDRTEVLRDKARKKTKPIVFVTNYNPAVRQLKRLLLKHWKILEQNAQCKQIFKSNPIISYKRRKNLQELLS